MEIRVLESENQVYQKEKLLGEGAFGKAYLVRQKQTGEMLVIKEVSIDHMSQKEREETIKEAQILRNFRHPLIVKFIEVYATKQNKLKIVMEYAECGDLSKAIHAQRTAKKFFEENQILDWFTQICLAMKHVHDRKILHRDIKGQNIFITKANTLKLGDFGIARVLNKTQDKARTVVGTPYYLSPEIIENKPYSFKSDIWSMGVLLYEMCALTPPFTANSLQLLALKIVKGSHSQLTGSYSKQLKGLIEQMLQLDPNRRPSVGDILKKPFLQDRIRKFLSETYRKEEFSHTILHNQKVEIANKLVKIQEEKKQVNLEKERNQLKEQAALLKEKMERKKQEEKQREDERLRRKREEESKKREQDMQKRKEYEQKQRQLEQKRAVEERKQWVEREKRKQEQYNRNLQEEEHRRVNEIAMMAKRRQQQEQQLLARKERLLQEKYEMERQRDFRQQEMRKRQNKEKESKKMDQFNELARKQWYENQMIRKRAEQRARQAEMESYSQPSYPTEAYEQPINAHRPQSNRNSRNNSREKPNQYEPHKKYSMPVSQPSTQQLQNALLNPNFNKKTPNSAKPKQSESKVSTNASNWSSKPKEEPKKKQELKNKKNYEEDRERIKRDREEFLKNKGIKSPVGIDNNNDETIKPAKWQRRSREKSRDSPEVASPPSKEQQPSKHPSETMMHSHELRLDIKDQEEFNDYLNELEDIIGNVNRNIQSIQNRQKSEPLPEIETVEEEIVVREDDAEELDYSITASFDNVKPPQEVVDVQNADFDYFSDYSKLQELRICLEDKFGTDTFIKIYRALEDELQKKSLQNFNILEVIKDLGNIPNANLIADNLPLLLTLIVMEERMCST